MFIKKKGYCETFEMKDSNEICLLKKMLLWNFLNVKFPSKYVCYRKRLLSNILNVKIAAKYVY